MTAAEIVKLIRPTTPFKPFQIHLSDGRSFLIEYLEFVALTGDRKALRMAIDPGEANNYQTTLQIDLDHIASVTEDVPRRPQ